MIETVLETPSTEERPSLAPVFLVTSPATNPFVTPGPVAFVGSADHLHLEWTDERDSPSSGAGSDLADEFVYRSRRDVDRHPGSPRALTNLGSAFMGAGNVDEAITAFEGALRLERSHYPAMAYLARARFLRDELLEAETLANSLRAQFPRDAVAPMMLGCVAVRRGRADDAVRELTTAVALDEKSALPHFLLGMVLLGMHRDQDAIGHLRKATRLDSRSPALQRGLGVAYASRGDLARATKALRTSLALDPNAAETVHALGRVLMQHGDTESAVQLLATFVDRHPRDPVAQELLAQGYKKQEQRRAVKRHLQRALESLEGDDSVEATSERARLMNNIGAACASSGALEEAERWYKRALDLAAHPVTFRNLFGIYSERSDIASAGRVLTRWTEMFPDDDHAAFQSAVQRAEAGDTRGVDDLRRLTQSTSVSARAYAALGSVLLEHFSNSEGAIAVLEEAYQKFPDDAAIANNLAYVCLMGGMPAEARRVLEGVKTDEVSDSVYLTATWGLLFIWEGDLERARRQYAQAAALAREKGRRMLAQTARQKMHLELARHYLRAGDSSLARAEIREGLASGGQRKYNEDLRILSDRLLSSGQGPMPPELTDGRQDK